MLEIRQFFITWFPTYRTTTQEFSLKELGTLGAIPALMGILDSVLGVVVSDWLYRKGFRLTTARKSCLVGGMLYSSVIALAVFTSNIAVILILFSITPCVHRCEHLDHSGRYCADAWPRATIGGVQNFASNLARIVTASFNGLMLAFNSDSFVIPLIVASGICVVGAASFLLIVGKIEPLQPRGSSKSEWDRNNVTPATVVE